MYLYTVNRQGNDQIKPENDRTRAWKRFRAIRERMMQDEDNELYELRLLRDDGEIVAEYVAD